MSDLKMLVKVLLDEKNFQIIKATAGEAKTTREIASTLNVSTSNLYYPIKKLMEIDALRVIEKTTIGNIVEHKYSSSHLSDLDINLNHQDDLDLFEQYIKLYLISQQKALYLIKKDLETNPEEDSAKLIIQDFELTKNQWHSFQDYVNEFIIQLKDENLKEKETYRISLAIYKQ